MCMKCQGTTEKDPSQGSHLNTWTGRATGKDWPKRPSDCQLQEGEKATRVFFQTLIGPKLLLWRQSLSLHTWHCQGPHKPRSCATFMLNSHCGRADSGKRSLVSMHAGSLRLCPTLCDLIDCGLPGFSVREGGSLGKNTGVY